MQLRASCAIETDSRGCVGVISCLAAAQSCKVFDIEGRWTYTGDATVLLRELND